MKANKILIAALALSAFAACSKSATEPDATEGGNASYLNVQIAYTDPSLTKAAGDDTNPFYYGTVNEQKVVSATFFFYNANGSYNTKVTRTIYEDSHKSNWQQGTENVEWVGKGVVLLTNVTNKPTYMGVVLNADDVLVGALTGKSSTEAEAVLTEKIATLDGSTWTNFVMSSSSYKNGNVKGYYLNTLKDTDFKTTEAEALAETSPVMVYVERLAAKVAITLTNTATGKTNQYLLGSYVVGGTAQNLYAKIDNWGLNATADSSYSYKSIDTTWTLSFKASASATTGTDWNDGTNFRSYWGKSVNYGKTSYYPDSFGNSTDSRNYDASKVILDYVSYNDLKVAVTNAAYCRENTNDPAKFTADTLNYNSTFTSILLKATLVDENSTALSVVNYEGQLYTVDEYKTRILVQYTALDADKYIPYKQDANGNYVKVTVADLKDPVDLHDGYTRLEFKDGAYYLGANHDPLTTVEATNVLNYGSKTAPSASTSIETRHGNTLALYYKDGQMYYTIPIEHLNNTAKYNNIKGTKCSEGDYGVVRNHYYNVTVNSIKNLGTAVYDPDEEIIPNDKVNQKYFLSAKVNILSWKLVNQTVDL